MTEQEINIGIAKGLGFEICYCGQSCQCFFQEDSEGNVSALNDYCNNWNDLMPLVIKYLSQLQAAECFYGEDPKRVLVECLFEVLESKNK